MNILGMDPKAALVLLVAALILGYGIQYRLMKRLQRQGKNTRKFGVWLYVYGGLVLAAMVALWPIMRGM